MPTELLSLKTLGFGGLCWLIPFLAAFPVFPLKAKRPVVFKAVMGVILAGAAAGLCRAYFAGAPPRSALDGLCVGGVWMAVCLAIDLPLFIKGFKMTAGAYLAEIGIAYLVIPLLAWQNTSLLAAAAS